MACLDRTKGRSVLSHVQACSGDLPFSYAHDIDRMIASDIERPAVNTLCFCGCKEDRMYQDISGSSRIASVKIVE